MAECALIDSRIRLLEKQRDDVVAAQKKQKENAVSKGRRAERETKGKAAALQSCRRESSQAEEVAEAKREIAAAGLAGFCTVLECR